MQKNMSDKREAVADTTKNSVNTNNYDDYEQRHKNVDDINGNHLKEH